MTKDKERNIARSNRSGLWLIWGFAVLAIFVLILVFVHRANLPEFTGVHLSESQMQQVVARNSSLTDYVLLSPNADFPRQGTLRKITVHYMDGDYSLEELGERFAQADRRVSANYGIDSQGNVGLYVEESNGAWASSSNANDAQAVNIQVADTDGDVTEAAYDKLIELIVDICRRNGIEELRYDGTPLGNLTIHSMFNEDSQCPGTDLRAHIRDIASEVTAELRNAQQTARAS